LETFTLLLLLKARCINSLIFHTPLRYPKDIALLRGNHESRSITKMYGFYDEVITKYGNAAPYSWCTEVFDYLSVAAVCLPLNFVPFSSCSLLILSFFQVIDGKYFCVHGGLSPDLRTIDQMRTIVQRNQEIPHSGPFCGIPSPENMFPPLQI
jgi:diadenosine tetraphosphatase ApaH/serine/threonine PP2A family protein phosphatase